MHVKILISSKFLLLNMLNLNFAYLCFKNCGGLMGEGDDTPL